TRLAAVATAAATSAAAVAVATAGIATRVAAAATPAERAAEANFRAVAEIEIGVFGGEDGGAGGRIIRICGGAVVDLHGKPLEARVGAVHEHPVDAAEPNGA